MSSLRSLSQTPIWEQGSKKIELHGFQLLIQQNHLLGAGMTNKKVPDKIKRTSVVSLFCKASSEAERGNKWGSGEMFLLFDIRNELPNYQ